MNCMRHVARLLEKKGLVKMGEAKVNICVYISGNKNDTLIL